MKVNYIYINLSYINSYKIKPTFSLFLSFVLSIMKSLKGCGVVGRGRGGEDRI